jgi:hypothetical protein
MEVGRGNYADDTDERQQHQASSRPAGRAVYVVASQVTLMQLQRQLEYVLKRSPDLHNRKTGL